MTNFFSCTGTVEYDDSVTTSLDIFDFVNGIGKFTSYINTIDGIKMETTTVNIQGMSCMKCVNNIQGTLLTLYRVGWLNYDTKVWGMGVVTPS